MKLVGFTITVLMVAFMPMTSVVHAQSAADTAGLTTLKQKAVDEINRRIANLQTSIQGLSYNVLSGTSSPTATPAITTTTTTIPDGVGDQIKTYAQKTIDELRALLTKVSSASSLTDMQKLADNVNSQFSLNQVTDVQASATQSIDSMSSVYSQLTSVLSSIKGQVAQLQACTSSDGASSSSSSDCSGLNTSNASSVLSTSDSQLSSISTITSTIGSMLTSAITLLITLLPTFTSMLSGLGGLGSIGNIGDLSNITDLSKLTSTAGSMTGILSSFTAIISQLDIGNGMSGGAFSSLTNLSSLINI
jgi:trimeric autotransporter adhesin